MTSDRPIDFAALARREFERAQREGRVLEKPEAERPPTREELGRSLEIPELYRGATLADFDAYDFARGRVPDFELPRDILVVGPNGVGKTHLAAAIALEWRAKWCRATRFVSRLRSAISGGGEYLAVIERLEGPRVLVLDDVTAIGRTDFAVEAILDLLDARLGARKITIATTYQDREQREAFDPSVASRLGGFERIVLVGEDRRKR